MAGAPAMTKQDPGFGHFLRFVLIAIAMNLIPIVGLIWGMIALSKTGRRKRDVLFYLIPIWGIVVGIQTIWRYTGRFATTAHLVRSSSRADSILRRASCNAGRSST